MSATRPILMFINTLMDMKYLFLGWGQIEFSFLFVSSMSHLCISVNTGVFKEILYKCFYKAKLVTEFFFIKLVYKILKRINLVSQEI